MEINNIVFLKGCFSDLKDIALVDKRCFPDSLLNILGGKLTYYYYKNLFKTPNSLFLIAKNNIDIVGFAIGYKNGIKNFNRTFIFKYFFQIIFRVFIVFISSRKNIFKIIMDKFHKNTITTLKNSINESDNKLKGHLLSICVLKEYRGSGIANSLISKYENLLNNYNYKFCLLSAKKENIRAINFYEKNGYEILAKSDDSISFGKKISNN